jgi:hypothetical protein
MPASRIAWISTCVAGVMVLWSVVARMVIGSPLYPASFRSCSAFLGLYSLKKAVPPSFSYGPPQVSRPGQTR